MAGKRPFSAQDFVRDMRTPLTSMMATAGLITGNATERATQLDSLQAYGRQLSSMMADIDDFERLLRGSVDIAEDTFDFPQLVRNCVTEAAPSVADRGIEIRVDVISGTPRWVQGDPSRVRQLLGRVLENSAWQCTLGPLEVTVFGEEKQLGVVIQNRTQSASVDDRSFGHMFCRQLALTLGGDFTVSTRDGGGTESRVLLPKNIAPDWEIDLLEEDAERTGELAQSTTVPRVQGKVLLVDDSADHQRLIGQLLARAGAEVTAAMGGSMALHLLEEMKFDLVLLDMQMPDMDGYATISEMRQRGITTPVLAVTADTAQVDIERALAAGCNGHLPKPIDPELLQRSLAMHLPVAVE
jgi:CheY-like chemotaxis protein